MEIRQLKYFVEVCNHRSFSKAAAACYISVQGISMALARLETELHTVFFEKTPHGLVLTKSAEFLLKRAESIICLTDECTNYFSLYIQNKEYLRILLVQGALVEYANVPLTKFRQKHGSSVHLNVNETDDLSCEKAVENLAIELALVSGPVDERKFDAELLHMEKRVIIVNPRHRLAARESIRLDELSGVELSIFRFSTRTQDVLKKICQKSGMRIKINTDMDNVLSLYFLVENSDAVGISTLSLTHHLAREDVRAIPIDDEHFVRTLYMIRLKNSSLSRHAQFFWDEMLEYRTMALLNKNLSR